MKKIVLFLLTVMLFFNIVVKAEVLSGQDILKKMDEVMKAEKKYMEEEMVLKTASGSERHRKLAVWNKNTDEGEKMLLKFLEPANLAGTGFLMDNDNMWLYLPALGKVKRIAGSAKQGSFMGSDLSYEDMEALGNTGFSVDYSARLLEKRDEIFKLELIPQNEDISYGKLVLLVDTKTYLPLQITYYNEEGLKIKVLNTSGHTMIDGNWTATELKMKHIRKGSTTVLKIKEVDFNSDINDRIFTIRNLERGN